MKLFCRHHYIEIENYQVKHWNPVFYDDPDDDWNEERVRLICDKCGKYKDTSGSDWKVISKRQELLGGNKWK